jgi:trk system potassium uptake protein TrkA
MKFCVIGVGRFGYHVAVKLAEHGMEVLAVDSNESIIASIRDKVTQAICMRVKDEESLRNIGVEEMDTVVVAMGENFAQSILVTALLKQKLKVPSVIARAISIVHKDILGLIGADHVVLPEQEMGIRLADKLSLSFSSLIRISENFSISYLQAPDRFIGKTIEAIHFEKNYHIACLGKREQEEVIPLESSYSIEAGDMLVFAGINNNLEKISKL